MSPLSERELRDMARTAGLPAMSIDDHRLCRQCDYDLIGLPGDSVCPECGTPIQSTSFTASSSSGPHAPIRSDKLLEYSEQKLKMLRGGLTLMAVAVPVLTLLPLATWMLTTVLESVIAAGIFAGASVCWVLGVMLMAFVPMQADHLPVNVRAWYTKIGWIGLLTQFFWIPAGLAWFSYAGKAASGTSVPSLLAVAVGFRLVAVIGLLPVCWKLSVLARAANDDELADRVWSIGWCLPSALIVIAGLGQLPPTTLAVCGGLFILFVLAVAVLVMQMLLVLCVFGVRSDVAWAIRHRFQMEDRAEALREKAERRAAMMQRSADLTLDDAPHASRPAELDGSRFTHGVHDIRAAPVGSHDTRHGPTVQPRSDTPKPHTPPKPRAGGHRIEPSSDGETYDIVD